MSVCVADTNIVSELMRPAPSAVVMNWIAALAASAGDELVITAVTRAELRYGIALDAGNRRRNRLTAALDAFAAWEVLPFDAAAADFYGEIAARRRSAGLGVSVADAMIAAIVAARAPPCSRATSAISRRRVSPSSTHGEVRVRAARSESSA